MHFDQSLIEVQNDFMDLVEQPPAKKVKVENEEPTNPFVARAETEMPEDGEVPGNQEMPYEEEPPIGEEMFDHEQTSDDGRDASRGGDSTDCEKPRLFSLPCSDASFDTQVVV